MNAFRFRNRLPEPGEGKMPSAELNATRDSAGIVTLWLYDVIDSWGGWWGTSAKEIRDALAEFPAAQVSEIHVHVNSPSGDVFEAAAINNLLTAHPAVVKVVVDGLAASAASVIAVRADELVMGVGTELMIHDAYMVAIGTASDLRAGAELLDKISSDIAGQYAAKAGGTAEEWRAAMLAETWYTAAEAVAAGLADRVGTLAEGAIVEEVSEGKEEADLMEQLIAATAGVTPRMQAALERAPRPAILESIDTPEETADEAAALVYQYRARAAAALRH